MASRVEECVAGRMIHLRLPGADNTICGAYPKYYAQAGIKPGPLYPSAEDRHRCRRCKKLRNKYEGD